MIKHISDKKSLNNLRGGIGEAEFQEIINENDINEGIKLFAKVNLKPNSSIGYHKHIGEGEMYFILKGEGIFINENKVRRNVKEGDACVIRNNESHGLENTSNQDMEIIALVFSDKH